MNKSFSLLLGTSETHSRPRHGLMTGTRLAVNEWDSFLNVCDLSSAVMLITCSIIACSKANEH